jgi:general secretion pathway protein G
MKKNYQSKKSAFSMIELVFVIVILAILSAVAIPRLTSIQDDALISSEKSAIGVARQGVVALYGKRVLRGGDLTITLTNKDGVDYDCNVSFTDQMYPQTLVTSATTGSTNNTDANATGYTASRGSYQSLALVVESESLADWSYTNNAGVQEYRGQASNTITDSNAEINNNNFWKYDNSNGKLILK